MKEEIFRRRTEICFKNPQRNFKINRGKIIFFGMGVFRRFAKMRQHSKMIAHAREKREIDVLISCYFFKLFFYRMRGRFH